MKLDQLRGQLREAELVQPAVYKRQTQEDDPNCPECLGRGIISVSEARGDERHMYDAQCKECGGSGLKLEGTKPTPKKPTTKASSALRGGFVEAMMNGSVKWATDDLWLTLVADAPDPADTFVFQLKDNVLTEPLKLVGKRLAGRVATADHTIFPAKAFKRAGAIIQGAVLHDKEGQLLAFIDFAKGGAGIVHDGADVTIAWDEKTGIFAL